MIKRVLVIACLMPSMAWAASFDCDKAHSPVEKAVCADATLSELDSAIATSYKAAMQRLSPDGQVILRNGQRQWLGFVRDLCIVRPDATRVGFCLTRHYQDRLKELSGAAVSIGPYLFSRNDYFSASTQDKAGRPYEIQASAPRIDAPLSPTIALWNSAMLKRAMSSIETSCDDQHGDEYSGFEVAYASARAISTRVTSDEYCHGTAHGHGGTVGVTDIIAPSVHALEAADLFNPDSAWADFLTSRSYDIINKKAEGANVDRAAVEDAATDLRNWTLTPEGLLITFDPYVVLAYASGTTEVTLAWRDLAPFLAPNAPIPDHTIGGN